VNFDVDEKYGISFKVFLFEFKKNVIGLLNKFLYNFQDEILFLEYKKVYQLTQVESLC
jgi:hypothetical protein